MQQQQEVLLTRNERAYLSGQTADFSKEKMRYVRCRLLKKLKKSNCSLNDIAAAATRCNGPNNLLLLLPSIPQVRRAIAAAATVVHERVEHNDDDNNKKKWAGRDSDSRSPPCQGGIITRLDHRPYIHTKKIWCPNICCRSSFHGTTLFTIVSIRRKMAPIKIY